MPDPIYWTPADMPAPAHIRTKAPNRLVETAGPEGRGGFTWGGPFREGDVWEKSEAGWWCCLNGATPKELLRVNAIKCFLVQGWFVPQILDGEMSSVGYWTASGFQVPEQVQPLVTALRGILDTSHSGVGQAHAMLAVEGLALNHHISIHELGMLRLLTPDFVWEVVAAMCGVPLAVLRS